MHTPLQIAFKDTESSEFLEALIRERVDRLERFHPKIQACRVVVEVPYRSASGTPPLGIAIEVEVPGKTLVTKRADELHAAKDDRSVVVNRAFDAMERQLEEAARQKRGDVKQREAARETGRVVRLFPAQNYGFIEVGGGSELYFTRNAVDGDFDALEVGALVEITRATTEGPMGPQASSVKVRPDRAAS